MEPRDVGVAMSGDQAQLPPVQGYHAAQVDRNRARHGRFAGVSGRGSPPGGSG